MIVDVRSDRGFSFTTISLEGMKIVVVGEVEPRLADRLYRLEFKGQRRRRRRVSGKLRWLGFSPGKPQVR